jgi:hypothetical protein
MSSSKTHRLSCSTRCLTSGLNATGIAALVSVEEVSRLSSERKDVAKCLFNAGDCTQRFCIENRCKLGRVNCIVLSSLAPHHVSGLIGVLLCLSDLGCGAVAIVGPVGLAGLLHNLTPFCNRKYPVISMHEVGANGSRAAIRLSLGLYDLIALPIFAAAAPQSSVGVAAVFVSGAESGGYTWGCMPVTASFPTSPSLEELAAWMSGGWGMTGGGARGRGQSCLAVQVVPLVAAPRGMGPSLCAKVKELCQKHLFIGVLTQVIGQFEIIKLLYIS